MDKKSKFQSAADLMKQQAEKLGGNVAKKGAKFQSAADMMEKQAAKLEGAQDGAKKTATKVSNLMAKQAKKISGGEKANRNYASKPVVKEYTVASGDSLSAIAKSQLGDSSHWKALYEANKGAIGDNPNNLKVGQVLKLPKVG